MRYEDLLIKIEDAKFPNVNAALWKVAKLHSILSNAPYCQTCLGQEYPCPTIQEIESALQ